jgi:hypothetical protein
VYQRIGNITGHEEVCSSVKDEVGIVRRIGFQLIVNALASAAGIVFSAAAKWLHPYMRRY